MAFRPRRWHLFPVILALAIAYGYFFSPGHQSPVTNPAPAQVSVPGPLSIQGPYFSDHDRIADRIIAAINHTRRTLDIAIYSLTQPNITAAIEAAHRRGVRVRIVSDEGQSRERHSETAYLKSTGIAVRLSNGFRGERSIMHNKFAIFDGDRVETGSFNWTTSATSYNFENAILITIPEVAARYQKEFDHIWAQAR
ncbi:MAG TPA: phospholipase D-like domain-containing protein [Terriglobia bacterium]|nr:phospholipase D-like domain-containing protein [Terriglobia bacterium]